MIPVIISIGSLEIHTYGLALALSFVISALAITRLARRYNVVRSITRQYYVLDIILWTIFVSLISARIGHLLIYPSLYRETGIFQIIFSGGFVFWVGFLGGLITLISLLKSNKLSVWRWLDIVSFGFVLALAIGYFGIFLSGDYQSILSSSRFSVDGRVPTPLYMSIGSLILTIVWQSIFQRFAKKEGYTFLVILLSFSILDFIVNFWQIYSVRIWVLTLAQFVDVILIGIVSYLLSKLNARSKVS